MLKDDPSLWMFRLKDLATSYTNGWDDPNTRDRRPQNQKGIPVPQGFGIGLSSSKCYLATALSVSWMHGRVLVQTQSIKLKNLLPFDITSCPQPLPRQCSYSLSRLLCSYSPSFTSNYYSKCWQQSNMNGKIAFIDVLTSIYVYNLYVFFKHT